MFVVISLSWATNGKCYIYQGNCRNKYVNIKYFYENVF